MNREPWEGPQYAPTTEDSTVDPMEEVAKRIKALTDAIKPLPRFVAGEHNVD